MKVLNAIAAPQRLEILKTINTHGPLTYVEIMNQLNLNPSRDTGKFAYHLRTLRQAGLVEVGKTNKKYRLTSLGIMVIDFSQTVEQHTLRERGGLLVRTSRLTMEEFDRNKIIHSLSKEASVPIDLAHKIASETEERLLKLDTLYLTAPLIREFVNSILIEKGLQEYRHKLTRLGLPVYDVTQLIKQAESSTLDSVWVERIMGKNVMTEYVLLDILPRRVADAHLSGQIHLCNVDMWVIKPESYQHDLRVFLKAGYKPSQALSMAVSLKPPHNFEGALAITSMMLSSSGTEVILEQGLPHFNLFLAPFVGNTSLDVLRDSLQRFLLMLNQGISKGTLPDVSLSVDLSVPASLKKVKATGIDGKVLGAYGEYHDESLQILEVILDLIIEDTFQKPLFLPHLILNIASSDLKDKTIQPLLLKAHTIAAKFGTLYFVNLRPEWQRGCAYFSTGTRLSSDWTGDFELDTMRTGNVGKVVINLPRLAYESKGNEDRFFRNLDDCLYLILDSLKTRYSAVEERINSLLLPFLSQKITDETYCRMKNTSLHIGFVGLNEAVKVMTGKQIHEDEQLNGFSINVIDHLAIETKKLALQSGFRLNLSQSVDSISPQRLAALDVEKFGWRTVFTQGTKSYPYYTDAVTVPLDADISLKKRLGIESRFHSLLTGGHLSLIELADTNHEALLKLTKDICQNYSIGAYAFTRSMCYCFNCQRLFYRFGTKCPECGAVKAFVPYSRASSRYLPLNLWSSAKRGTVNNRTHYSIV